MRATQARQGESEGAFAAVPYSPNSHQYLSSMIPARKDHAVDFRSSGEMRVTEGLKWLHGVTLQIIPNSRNFAARDGGEKVATPPNLTVLLDILHSIEKS
jgi:hypothetical protein